jgi:hypothetical protein
MNKEEATKLHRKLERHGKSSEVVEDFDASGGRAHSVHIESYSVITAEAFALIERHGRLVVTEDAHGKLVVGVFTRN